MKRALITLDLDHVDFYEWLEKNRHRLFRAILALWLKEYRIIRIKVSKTSKGYHIYFYLNKKIDWRNPLVFAFRGALQDDPGRIARDMLRMANGEKIGMLIFRVKNGRVNESIDKDASRALWETIKDIYRQIKEGNWEGF